MLAPTWIRHELATAALLLSLCLACAHGSGRSPNRSPDAGGSASIITRAQIDSLMARYPNAYDLIRTIRSNMLLTREVRIPHPVREGLQSDPSGVKVFIDDVYVGGVEMLRRIPSRSIIFVQHLSSSDATTRFGSGMVGGAIVITTGTRWR